jgi:UDP-N-acetylmuramate--alanine ligase
MELIWKNSKWTLIYSDYWHIAESIWLGFEALKKKYPDKKLFVIFQPHQISRIAQWRNEFKQVLPKYDKVVIYDIYAARESIDLVKTIWIESIDNFETLAKEIESFDENYIIVYFSAGDLDFKIRNLQSIS